MININFLKAVLVSLVCCSCDDPKQVIVEESDQQIAQNFLNALEVAHVEEWSNPMNPEFRELIIKGGRPIAHVDYVGVNYIEESPEYEDNVLLITIKMLMEEPLFKSREYTLKATMFSKKGVKSYVKFKPIETKIGTVIKNSKLSHCSVFYHITLKELNKIHSCKITFNEKEDVVLSPILTKEIKRVMNNLYEKSIKAGKAAGGVFSSDIRF